MDSGSDRQCKHARKSPQWDQTSDEPNAKLLWQMNNYKLYIETERAIEDKNCEHFVRLWLNGYGKMLNWKCVLIQSVQ